MYSLAVLINFISDSQYKNEILNNKKQRYWLLSEATREAHGLIELVSWWR